MEKNSILGIWQGSEYLKKIFPGNLGMNVLKPCSDFPA